MRGGRLLFDIHGWQSVIIAVIAMLLIGPERLPGYVAKLRAWIRDLRSLAEGAKDQLREQMGPEFDDVDWKAYDPRQYDPRRIVREALFEDQEAGVARAAGSSGMPPAPAVYDPARPTPYDDDAT